MKLPETTFDEIANAIEDRFKDKQPDQYHYSMFQDVQHKGEYPNDFLDRLRDQGEMFETKTDDPAKQEIIRSELQNFGFWQYSLTDCKNNFNRIRFFSPGDISRTRISFN